MLVFCRKLPSFQATLTLFQKDGVAFIQVFTEKIKGEKYKIKGNIAKCMTKCIPDGKITIELLEPRIQEWFVESTDTHICWVGCIFDAGHFFDTGNSSLGIKYMHNCSVFLLDLKISVSGTVGFLFEYLFFQFIDLIL